MRREMFAFYGAEKRDVLGFRRVFTGISSIVPIGYGIVREWNLTLGFRV